MRGKKNILNSRRVASNSLPTVEDSASMPVRRGDFLLFKSEIIDNKGKLTENWQSRLYTLTSIKRNKIEPEAEILITTAEILKSDPRLIVAKPARIAITIGADKLKETTNVGGAKFGAALAKKAPLDLLDALLSQNNLRQWDPKALEACRNTIFERTCIKGRGKDYYSSHLPLLSADDLRKLVEREKLDTELIEEMAYYLKGGVLKNHLQKHANVGRVWEITSKKMLKKGPQSSPANLALAILILKHAPRKLNELETEAMVDYIKQCWNGKMKSFVGQSSSHHDRRFEAQADLLEIVGLIGQKTSSKDKALLEPLYTDLKWFEASPITHMDKVGKNLRKELRTTISKWPILSKEEKARLIAQGDRRITVKKN